MLPSALALVALLATTATATPRQLQDPESGHECNATKGCNVCLACCKSYIGDGKPCNRCVKQECHGPPAPPGPAPPGPAPSPGDVPRTCALYFDFPNYNPNKEQKSDMFLGIADKESQSMTKISDLGYRPDTEGMLSVSSDGSSVVFTTTDNSTEKKEPPYGCCDRVTLMSVNIATGAPSLASLKRLNPIQGSRCGIHGCGFIGIGGYDAKANTTVAWVEQLLPPAPPTAPRAPRRNQHRQLQPGGNFEGLALVTFDLNDESAVTRNPFHMNMDKGPGIIDGGMVCVDGADRYWFACKSIYM